MKKILIIILTFILCLSTTACLKQSDASKFKKEYESLNGNKYREVSISKENPFVYQTAEELSERIDNKETFVVFFGYAEDPWCRTMVEQLIKSAKDNNIEKIYYVNVRDIRDEFELSEAEGPVQTSTGTEGYNKLLDQLQNVLKDYYVLNSSGDKVNTKEKRIYTPNVVAVVNGTAEKLVEGISTKLEDPYGKLTDEMLKESYNSFKCIWECYQNDANMCQKNTCQA